MKRKSTRRKAKDEDAAALAKAAAEVAAKVEAETEAINLEMLESGGLRTRNSSSKSKKSNVTFVEEDFDKLQLTSD